MHRDAIGLAHNAKGYDAQFLVRELAFNGARMKIVPRQLSVLNLEACGVEVKCTMSFMPTRLSNLPKMFNFQHEVVKGMKIFTITSCNSYRTTITFRALSVFCVIRGDHRRPKTMAST